jgi:transporter family-2 protein
MLGEFFYTKSRRKTMNQKLAVPFILFSGMIIIVANVMNGLLAEKTGLLAVPFWVHFTGAIPAFFLYLRDRRKASVWLQVLTSDPSAYLGGFFGIFATMMIAFSVMQIGAFVLTLLLISTQLILSVVVDHFGLFGFERSPLTKQKVVSVCMILGGMVMVS